MTINNQKTPSRISGIFSAFLSPTFLGFMPIVAKIAYSYGVDVNTVAALRTVMAAAVLWVIALVVDRNYIFSSKPAILGSLFAGAINGVGSLFFYSSLTRIDASMGQLINITYLVYVTLLFRMAGYHISKLTVFRTVLAIFAIYVITSGALGEPDWIGVSFMAIAALSYAIQIVFSQRIMQDVPAMTMTLYALTGMSTVVAIAWLIVAPEISHIPLAGWGSVIAIGVMTALARLTLFLGVKNLGGMQTSLIGVAEVLVSIFFAYWLLGEVMTMTQWVGAAILTISILLVKYETAVPSFDWLTPLLLRVVQKQPPPNTNRQNESSTQVETTASWAKNPTTQPLDYEKQPQKKDESTYAPKPPLP